MPTFTDPNSRFDWLMSALAMNERARAFWPTLHALMQADLGSSGAMQAVQELVAFEDELRRPVLRVAKEIAAHRMDRADARRATALLGVGLVQFAALGFGFRLLARGPEQRKALANEIAAALAVGHVARAIDERLRDDDRCTPGLFARAVTMRLPRLLVALCDFRMLRELDAPDAAGGADGTTNDSVWLARPPRALAEGAAKAWTRKAGTLEAPGDDEPAIRVAAQVVSALVAAEGRIDDPLVERAMTAGGDACDPASVRHAVELARASFTAAVGHLELPDALAGERWTVEPAAAMSSFPWPPAPSLELLPNGAPENAVWCVACTVRELVRPDGAAGAAEAMEKALFALQKGMGFHRALVFLRDATGDMRVRHGAGHGTRGLVGKLGVPMAGQRSGLHDALATGELFALPATASSFDTPVWVDQSLPGARSMVIVPLMAGGACNGFLYADRQTTDPLLAASDRIALRKLAEALVKALTLAARARRGDPAVAARLPAA